jgi:hypothetical protein
MRGAADRCPQPGEERPCPRSAPVGRHPRTRCRVLLLLGAPIFVSSVCGTVHLSNVRRKLARRTPATRARWYLRAVLTVRVEPICGCPPHSRLSFLVMSHYICGDVLGLGANPYTLPRKGWQESNRKHIRRRTYLSACNSLHHHRQLQGLFAWPGRQMSVLFPVTQGYDDLM